MGEQPDPIFRTNEKCHSGTFRMVSRLIICMYYTLIVVNIYRIPVLLFASQYHFEVLKHYLLCIAKADQLKGSRCCIQSAKSKLMTINGFSFTHFFLKRATCFNDTIYLFTCVNHFVLAMNEWIVT